MSRIKVEPFLMKKGNRVAKAAIEFDSNDSILAGWHLIGFTICEHGEDGLDVLFPASKIQDLKNPELTRPFFFLKPSSNDQLDTLKDLIIEEYNRVAPEPLNTIKEK